MTAATTIIGRPMARSGRGSSGDGPQWLITFADLAAVLVAFFVLMFSMSEVDTDRWNGAVDSLDRQFDVTSETERARPTAEVNISQLLATDGLELGYLRRVLAGHIAEQPSLKGAQLRESEDSLVLSLPGSLVFESGGSAIGEDGRKSVAILAGVLGRIENDIEVVGHADPRLVGDGQYDTNWELSLARAASVARALNAAGISRPIRVVGVGASRFGDIDAKLPEDVRLALARRVDLVVRETTGGLR